MVLYCAAMTSGTDDAIAAAQSSVPLLSRRRGTLSGSGSSDHNNDGGDIEQGGPGLAGGGGESISVRVKTAGDGREYKVSSLLTATIAQVRGVARI